MDYSKTVNLLKTEFPMRGDLPKREPGMLERWEKMDLYGKIQEKNKDKPTFLLHDGPPYANGAIHMGTALNKVLKDFVVKEKGLSGFRSPYKPGWDCHGLPIEHALFKQLGKSKHDVSQAEIRKRATEYALGFVDTQRADFKRLGVLADWDNPYLTLKKEYEAGILEIFFELRRKNAIYRGLKPGYWCAFDETALAEAEVDYANKTSDSVYARFAVKPESLPQPLREKIQPNGKKVYVLIWTTTPWTLPANVGLAFHPEEQYGAFEFNSDIYLFAKKLKEPVSKNVAGEFNEIGRPFKGKEAVGVLATNPLHGRESKVVTASYVTMEDGTGVVHIAPGHGVEDFAVGQEWKLDVISPVDERGRFTDEVGHADLVGKHVLKDANKAVIEALGAELLFHQRFQHSYPHCWRCKNPIIFRATKQWFLRVDDALRNKLLTAIDGVRWEPDYGIHRIKGMVEQRPDWCLSRQRHWGAPIAVFYCKGCGGVLMDDAVDKFLVSLVEKEGTDAWFNTPASELLKSFSVKCSGCGQTDFEKEKDILDVWFDSGVSWHSVVERELSNPKPETIMYLEGSDQHRGWFQTSLIPSVTLRDKAPYDVVLTHGFVVDGKGKKMSKSMGNVIAPQEIIKDFGADVLRLWVALSDYREDIRLSKDIVKQTIDVYRRFRNTFRFLLQNTSDFKLADHKIAFSDLNEIDQWILSLFEDVRKKALNAYDRYEFHVVLGELNQFAAVALSGFYLDTLKDVLYCDAPNSHRRRSAQTALYHLARGLALVLGPLISFTSEEAYLELRNNCDPSLPESVFLDDFSSLEKIPVQPELQKKWQSVLSVRRLVNDVLDRERKAGALKSSQEASVRINPEKLNESDRGILKEKEGAWSFLFQVAQVETGNNQDNAVVIQKTSLHKCPRCWRYLDDIGADSTHPELCGRCSKVLSDHA